MQPLRVISEAVASSLRGYARSAYPEASRSPRHQWVLVGHLLAGCLKVWGPQHPLHGAMSLKACLFVALLILMQRDLDMNRLRKNGHGTRIARFLCALLQEFRIPEAYACLIFFKVSFESMPSNC